MTLTLSLTADPIYALDLTPVRQVIDPWLTAGTIAEHEQTLQFAIDVPRAPDDPRELSEIPELRLWFIRLDSCYPWFPFLLDWRSGELARYTAMLVPHQFQRVDGIRYNPEALEIFVMHKVCVLHDWLQQQALPSHNRLKAMAQLLGYELADPFFELLAGQSV